MVFQGGLEIVSSEYIDHRKGDVWSSALYQVHQNSYGIDIWNFKVK